jgi:hypothetical protein
MNTTEQIAIMKYVTRLANRARTEGIANWTPEARAKSLAVRRAKGSVWGWDKRPRYKPFGAEKDSIDLMSDALSEADAKRRKQIALEDAGKTFIGPRDKYADEIAAQRLESFKAWLAEVKRVEGAIDQFNGTVAALGGLTSGVALARKGKSIGPVTVDPAAEAAAKKIAVEKSIRRNFEKRNADHLRKYPEERPVMLDMVAEKAEYYSAQPARKVEMEKAAYRRIRDEGISSMREVSDYAAEFKTALEAKRTYVREREAVKPQLRIDEVAYPVGNGRWVAQRPDGSERVIDASPTPVVLKLTTPDSAPKKTGKLIEENDWADMLQDGRYLIGGRYFDHVANRFLPEAPEETLASQTESDPVENRHTSACAQSKSEKCNCSCGGAQHGTQSSASGTEEDGKPEEEKKPEPTPDEEVPENSPEFETLLAGFRDVISKGGKPTRRTLIEQFKKDLDGPKLQLAIRALAEAWHTYSLDKFQNKFGRDPKNNVEFRTFQKKSGVPPEFIGGK